MGNSTSSRAKAASVKAEAAVGGKVSNKKQQSGAGGRKVPSSPFSKKNKEKSLPSSSEQRSSPAPPELSEEPVLVEADDDETYETESDEEYDSSEEEDEEFDEFLAERLRILADAAALKRTAEAFLHPERPVVTSDPTACARSYFDRASAPEQESAEEAEARAQILADAAALKEVAARYLHPELPVVTSDATATARCYFDRASAPEQESAEEAEARAQILADAAALKERAVWHAHPELPVVTSDATATARCYFDRASAPEQESAEEAEARAQILADAAALKEVAARYLHPELPVVTSDATATARCYFDRASAPEQESAEEAEARAQVLADAAALKERAVWHAHPELPVVTSDATATARCYFDRASAPFNAEEIVSTSAYATETAQEKPEEESLEDHMQKLQALAPASSVKTVPAAGPVASVPHSASEVNLFDLQDA